MVNSGLILLPGKLTGLLIYVYNMQPLFEGGNNSQNCQITDLALIWHYTKLFLNLLIQFYLNNVINLQHFTSHSTTSCRITWRSYCDHRLL